MDLIHTLVWIFRGYGWITLGLLLLVAAVYVHVPLQSDVAMVYTATQVAAR